MDKIEEIRKVLSDYSANRSETWEKGLERDWTSRERESTLAHLAEDALGKIKKIVS